MKYSDETIEAVSDSTGLSEGQLRYIYIYIQRTRIHRRAEGFAGRVVYA